MKKMREGGRQRWRAKENGEDDDGGGGGGDEERCGAERERQDNRERGREYRGGMMRMD